MLNLDPNEKEVDFADNDITQVIPVREREREREREDRVTPRDGSTGCTDLPCTCPDLTLVRLAKCDNTTYTYYHKYKYLTIHTHHDRAS